MDKSQRTDPLATPEELQPIALPAAPLASLPAAEDNSKDLASLENAAHTYASHDDTPLLSPEECGDFRTQWDSIQTSFVDEPHAAVQQADNLVALTMKRLTETFAAERAKLEQQWDNGDEASTEDLRQALQRYRSFFQRLLTV